MVGVPPRMGGRFSTKTRSYVTVMASAFRDEEEEEKDPNILPLRLPKRRRLGFEAYEDVIRALKWSAAFNAGLLVLCFALCFVLFQIYRTPPFVLTGDRGEVVFKTTEAFKISQENLFSYCRETMGTLYDTSPGYYNISPLVGKVSPRIIEAFTGQDLLRKGMDERIDKDVRRIYRLMELRRFDSGEASKYALMARGEMTVYKRVEGRDGTQTVIPESNIVFHILYVDGVRPSFFNPYGLFMVGIRPISDKIEINRYWPSGTQLKSFEDIQNAEYKKMIYLGGGEKQ